MKKLYIGLSVLLVVTVLIAGFWVNAYNGYITKSHQVTEKRGNVYATLSARYEKLGTMIDTIESANQTVQGYLDTIMAARTAFADALSNNNFEDIDTSIQEINSTFINLVSYVEDNPSSYNTTSLYSNALAEFNASTNVVLNAILSYNAAVTTYNNHTKTFPNNIFIGSNQTYTTYEVTNYNQTLPSFSD